MEHEDIQDIFNGELVTEMASGASTLVSLNPEVVSEITQGDDDPVFVTYSIESGWSQNKRYWPPEILANIAEQVNKSTDVVGYQGHISPAEDGFKFPEIGIQWLKAVPQITQDKVKLLIKGYALPGTKAREYVKRKLAKQVSVSGDAILRPIQGGVAVKEFDLKSIDLARPRTGGMKTGLIAVTQEMEGGNVKPEEIAALQENELRAHNPGLVKTIEDEATKPLTEKVTEMESANGEAKANTDLLAEIRTMLGVDEEGDLLEALGNSMSKIKESAKLLRQKIIDEVLEKKFKNEKTRGLVQRVLVTEMEGELTDSMTEEEVTTKVTEMVEKAIDEDENLKSFLSESGGGHSLTSTSTENRGSREVKAGYENERISVRKAGGR